MNPQLTATKGVALGTLVALAVLGTVKVRRVFAELTILLEGLDPTSYPPTLARDRSECAFAEATSKLVGSGAAS